MSSSDDMTPALTPPPGQQSDFVDPSSIAPTIIAALTVCLVVSTISALSRVIAQWYLFKKLIWADFWMLLAWSSNLIFAGLLYACIPYGAGRHQWNVSVSDFSHIQYLLFIDFIIYDLAITGAKISILLQLKAIFCSTSPSSTYRNRFYWSILALILINIGFYLALSFALLFQCQPIARGWDPSIAGTCLDQQTLLASSGPFNIVSDFLIFLLPIYAIWRLQLPIKKRLEVCCAFAVGLFGCLCSAVRLVYSERLALNADATTLIFENQLWAEAEITAGVLIANAIILPRFIRHLRGKRDASFAYPVGNQYGATYGTYNGGGGTGDRASRMGLTSPRRGRGRGLGPMSSATDPWIELKDSASVSQGPSTVVSGASGGVRGSGEADSLESLERPYGGMGIVKTVQIETRTEMVEGAGADVGVGGAQVGGFEEPWEVGMAK